MGTEVIDTYGCIVAIKIDTQLLTTGKGIEMGSSETFGTNATSSTQGGLLPPSLLESASLSAPLADSLLSTPEPKTSGGYTPPLSKLDTVSNSNNPQVVKNATSYIAPASNIFSPVSFYQPSPIVTPIFAPTTSSNNQTSSNSKSTDPLTGTTTNTAVFTGTTANPLARTTTNTAVVNSTTANPLTSAVKVQATPTPNTPSITAALSRDTAPNGGTNSDKITFDPSIAGKITNTSRIKSFEAGFNNTPLGKYINVISDLKSDGSFSFNRARLEVIYGRKLPDGPHVLHLIAKDERGNSDKLIVDVNFTLDTVAPTAPTNLDLIAASDTGVSSIDNITNNNRPTITGNAAAGSIVQLFNNQQVVGQTTTSSNGTWQITTNNLTDGNYTLTAIATDIAGNASSTSTPLMLTVDTTLPTLTLQTPVNNAPLTQTSRLVGSINGTGSNIVGLAYAFDDLGAIPISFSTTGTFDQLLNLSGVSNGTHTLTITTTDVAGNVSTNRFNVAVNLDNTAPSITAALAKDTGIGGTTDADKITSDPTIVGTVTDSSQVVELRAGFNDTPTTNFTDIIASRRADGSFTLSRTQLETINGGALTDGQYTLHLLAKDEYGNNTNVFDFTFTLDTTAPVGVALNLDNGNGTSNSNLQTTASTTTLRGQTEANALVVLQETNSTITADAEGKFQFTNVPLLLGANPISLRVTDTTGNKTIFTNSITRLTGSDVVLDWNAVLLKAIQADRTAPPQAARNMAMVHIAMYDAVNAITRKYGVYHVDAQAPVGASAAAAAAEAAYRILVNLYPQQKPTFDAALAASLATVPDGTSENDGVALGQRVADEIILWRSTDRSNAVVAYTPNTAPGDWQPTSSGYGAATLPEWGQVTPFAMTSGSQFRPAGPPALTSDKYTADFNQVKELGRINSTTRTAEQTQIANFWADNAGTYTPPGHWNQIAEQAALTRGNSLEENARLFALLNIGLADAGIAAWDAKYTYDFWRPITAIRQADSDGNAATISDPNWTPLLSTPPFPEYVSGHSTFSGTADAILTNFFGNNFSFTTNSLGVPGVTRTFSNFTLAAEEAGMSRIYGGIHFQSANADGLATGRTVGNYVFQNFLTSTVRSPIIQVGLANDTAAVGGNNRDLITSDPTIAGSITASSPIRLRVGFGDTALANFVDVTTSIAADGRFVLDKNQLAAIYGTQLQDGAYTLHLRVEDLQGNRLASDNVVFTLDTTKPTVALQYPSATGNYSSTARLIGSGTDAGTQVTSARYSVDGQAFAPLTVNNLGQFNQAISTSGLAAGTHNLLLEVFDAAGNATQTPINFTVSNDFVIKGTGTEGWGVKTSNSLILGEQNSFVTQTSMEIALGQTQGKRLLTFDLNAQFDTSDTTSATEDRFLVYLVNSTNPSLTLLDRGEPGTALFAWNGRTAEYTPGLVNYDGRRVQIDLSSLATQTTGSLVFQLLNNDSDTGSVVRVQNLTNTVDPNGVSSPVFPNPVTRATSGQAVNLDTYRTTLDAKLTVSNVRLDAASGRYVADLQVRNTGTTTLSRQLAVLLTNLPAGVNLLNASGLHPAGSPYINFSNAIRPGGLISGAVSDVIQIVFNDPSLVRFGLQPVFLVGPPDTAPQLNTLGSLSVTAGGRLEVLLAGADARDGQTTFSLRSAQSLPMGELTGDGTLIFTPKPDQVGTYNFTIVATKNGIETTQNVTLAVTADPITTTRISGVVQDINQAPLAGVVVELGGRQVQTAADGSFQLAFEGPLPSDVLKIRGELIANSGTGGRVYPFIAEKLSLVLEHSVYMGVNNVISRPIYLPPLDVASGSTIDPSRDVTVTNNTPALRGSAVFVAANSLFDTKGNPFTGTLSITEVPPNLTPAALPENLRPDIVVTIQPGEMVFSTPAPLTLPNRAGFAPGTEMELWSINPNTGLFDNVGTGQVSADGTVIATISGGIRNSSWHFFAPRLPRLKDPNQDPRNQDKGCNPCEESQPFNSSVMLHSGAVVETHDLVGYQSLGASRGISLRYDSLRADPRQIVHFGYDQVPANSNNLLTAKLAIKRGDFQYQLPGVTPGQYGLSGGEHFWSLPAAGGTVDAALQVDLRDQPSGQYGYDLTAGLQLFSNGRFTGAATTTTGTLISINSINSVFGSGWEFSGWQQIVQNNDGSVLLIDGDGSQFLFKAPATAGSAYVSPPGDFSKLERLADGTFRRTTKDQTVYRFNTQNKLVSVRDRNGNETQYLYNTVGQLTQIIDPIGLATTFTYTGARVTSITDPANRVTLLEYDTKGNLIKITDPDSTSRTWEYDNEHHMIAGTDKRGNRGQDFYDFAGRATGSIRKDGSRIQVSPVAVQGLYRPEETLNPVNAPVAYALGAPEASYVDGNNHVVRILLDRGGQAVSATDGEGTLPSVQRNNQNLVNRSVDGNGNVSLITYDSNGNVLNVRDELSGGSSVIGSISRPGEQDAYTFRGTAGQRIYLDVINRGGYYTTSVKLISPSGQEILNHWLYDSDTAPIALAQTGTYRLIVDGNGDSTDNYNFNLLDVGQATTIALDTDVSGQLNPGRQTQLYQFNATQGQNLFLDSLQAPPNTYWKLYNASNRVIINSSVGLDQEFAIPVTGTYVLAIQGESDTPVNYKFRIITPERTTATLTLGDNITPNSVTGSIGEKGEQDTYTFNGTAGQRVYFDVLNRGVSYTNVAKLISPSGAEIINRWLYDSDANPVTLTETGTYRLVIDGYGENTDSYRFSLLDVSRATAITLDTDITGQLNPGRQTHLYQFQATVGLNLYLDSLNAVSNTNWTLYDASNQIVMDGSASYDQELTIATTGTYTLAIKGNSDTPVNYKFRIITPERTTATLTLGDNITPNSVSGSIGEKGEQDTYTFNGTAGQRLYFDVLSRGGYYTNIAKLISPSGAEILNRWLYDSDANPVTLIETGTYRLVIDGYGENVDSYNFSLLDVSKATNIALNTDTISGRLNPGQATHLYKFAGTSGQQLYLDSLLNSPNVNWTIYNSANQVIDNRALGDYQIALPSTDTYILAIRGNSSTAVDYQFQVREVAPGTSTTPSGTSIALGNLVSGTIATTSQQDTYTFSGTAGQQLFYDAFGSNNLRVRVYDPVGNQIYSTGSSSDGGPDRGLTLAINGTYRVVVDSNSYYTGNYKFRFLDKASAAAVQIGQTVSGRFDTATYGAQESYLYRFSLTGDQLLYFDAQVGDYTNRWSLYGSGGQFISSDYLSSDRESRLSAGEYLLAIQGQGGSNLDYRMRLVAPALNTTAMTLGSTVSGTISQPGQQDTYTFSGTAGQQLFYDALGNNYFSVQVYDPAGRKVYDADSRYDSGPDRGLSLTIDGTYRVVVDGYGDATGNYKFRFLDKASAAAVQIGQTVSGRFDTATYGAQESYLYRFSLTGDQLVYFDAQVSDYTNRWSLYGSGGQFISSDYLSSDRDNLQLTAGEYLLAIQGQGGSNLDYRMRLVAPAFNTTAMTVGSTVTGTISQPGQQDTYTFRGTAGQQLFYDALGGDYFSLQVYDPTGRKVYDADSRYDSGPERGLSLTMDGTYRVVVDGYGDSTGNYKFRFLDKAAAPIVALNTDITGRFNTATYNNQETYLYRFSLTSDQLLYFDSQVSDYTNRWTLYSPSGQILSSNYLYGDGERRLSAGEYLLAIQGQGGSNADYRMRLVAPQLTTTTLTIGATVSGSIDRAGEQDTFSFSGTVGQRLYFDGLDADFDSINVQLVSPSGTSIVNINSDSNFGPFVLNETGNYQLLVDGSDATTGDYSFRLLDLGGFRTLSLGTTVSGKLNSGTEVQGYQFNGRAGQRIYIDSLAATASSASWRLLSGSNQNLASSNIATDLGSVTLPADGAYVLLVEGTGARNTTLDYQFRLTDVSDAPVAVSGFGTVNSGTIAAGQQITFSFTANAGQMVYFDSQDPDYDPVEVDFRDPQNALVFSTNASYDRQPVILQRSGTYTLTVRGTNATATGDYKFQLLNLQTDSTPLTLNTTIRQPIDRHETKVYSFTATAGQQIYYDGLDADRDAIFAQLVSPSGAIVFNINSDDNSAPLTLTEAGTYRLLVNSSNSSNSDYAFALLDVSRANLLSFNTPITGSLDPGLSSQIYRFNGTAGQRLFFDSRSTSSSANWQLYGPDNRLIANTLLNSDFEQILPGNGSYTLVLAGNNTATRVDYNLVIVSADSTTDVALVVGAAGSGRSFTYDSTFNQITSITDELGHQTLYDIDPVNGNIKSMTRVVGAVGGGDDLITRYTYTSRGLLDTITDALGRITDFDYDASGRLQKITFAKATQDEAVRQFEYDAAGNQTAVIDENNNRTEYRYDSLNRLRQIIAADPDGSAGALTTSVTQFDYDADSHLQLITDARNYTTQYKYDALGRRYQIIDASGSTTTTEYDQKGNPRIITDARGNKTEYKYDTRDRLSEIIDAESGRIQFRYDANNNRTAIIDARGNQTNFVYDARNRLVKTIDALDNKSVYQYDAANNLIATIDANGRGTRYEYDDLNRQKSRINAVGNVRSTTYDAVGNVRTVTDELGRVTTYSYDNRSRLRQTSNALGGIVTLGYDAVGNLLSLTDELNRTTGYRYDARNRRTQVIDPLNNATTYSYDAVDNLTAVTDALGRTTTYNYDSRNRRNRITNVLGDTVATSYDALGNVTAITDELGRTTSYTYDKLNRLKQVTDPLTHTTTRNYDRNSNLTSIVDALGNTTSYSYDARNRRTAVTDARNQTTTTSYDAVGNVSRITDSLGNNTTYTYDALDRLLGETNQLGLTHSYSYDAVGNLTGEIDRNQRQRTYTYDALDRQTAEKWLDTNGNIIRTISYNYNAAGEMINAGDPDSRYSYTYDLAGRLATVDNTGTVGVPPVLLNYSYDAVGNLTRVTDTINSIGRGITEYTYDNLNRTTRITQSGTGVVNKRVDMSYDAASQLKSISRYGDLNGTQLVASSTYNYDAAGRLSNLTHARGTTTLAAYSFEYDAIDRITRLTSPDGTSNYSYDAVDQLTGVDHSYQSDEAYSYDGNGNRTNTGYRTGSNNQLLSDGIYNYEYDNEGNRTKRTSIATGEVTEYVWDYRNRLTVVTVKNAAGVAIRTAQYAYDVFDRRIAKVVDPDGVGSAVATTERFVYDGDDIVLSFDSSGTQTHRYLYGTGVDQVLADENAAGQVLWALADNQGTVRDVVNSAGTVVNHITYDSYGNVKTQTNPAVEFRFGYTGRELDGETGQYYYRARYYDAAVGRFISEDTIGFAAGDANLYRYVFNSPTNGTDPSGNIALAAPVVVGGGLLLLGGAYILNNPQAREVVRDLPKHLPSLLNNLNPFRVDPLANGEVRQPERFPKRTPVDGVGGVGGFNDGERVNIPNHTGGGYSPRLDFPTLSPFPGNVPVDKPRVETFPGCYEPALSPPFFQSNPYVNYSKEQLLKSQKSYERLIEEHQQKLQDYVADPYAYDNKGTLKNAPPEVQEKIINGRVKALEAQIRKQEGELAKINQELEQRSER